MSYFQALFKKSVETRTFKERILFQDISEDKLDAKKDFPKLFKAYSDALLLPGFTLGEEEWELVATLLDKEILVFTQNHQHKVETTKPLPLIQMVLKESFF